MLHTASLGAAYHYIGLDVKSADSGRYFETKWLLDRDIEGSARRYLSPDSSADSSLVDSLFAIDFRPVGMCAGTAYPQWCFEFEGSNYQGSPFLFPGERVYLVQNTNIGPDAETALPSRVVISSFVG